MRGLPEDEPSEEESEMLQFVARFGSGARHSLRTIEEALQDIEEGPAEQTRIKVPAEELRRLYSSNLDLQERLGNIRKQQEELADVVRREMAQQARETSIAAKTTRSSVFAAAGILASLGLVISGLVTGLWWLVAFGILFGLGAGLHVWDAIG